MSWFVPAFDLWLNVTLTGLALTAAASLAVLAIRQPARKIRVIQLTLVGLLALPALALLPGYPRATLWPAVAERTPIAMEAKNPPAKPGATPVSVPQRVQPPASLGSFSTPLVDAAPPEPASMPDDATPRANSPHADARPTQPIAAEPIAPSPIAPTTITPAPPRALRPAASTPRERSTAATPSLPDYRRLILSAYLLGVALLALWWLVGRVAMWRLLRTSAPAEPHVRGLLAEIAATHTGQLTANHVRLLVSPRAAQPCAFGWLRPTIILPERVVKQLTPDQLRLALSHEWSHVARSDIRTWMLASLVRLVHFHQPLVWLLRRELRISQDYLADAAAAGASTPEDYAELLTTLSRMLCPTPLSPGLGIAPRRSELYRRVVMLVDQSRPLERTIPRRWNVAAVMLGIALIAGVATLRAEPEAAEPAPAEKPAATEASPAARSEDVEKKRRQFETEVAKLRDEIAGLRLSRDYLKQQAAMQILTKERDRIHKQITPIDQQLAELEQKLDNRWSQLASQLAGQTPPTNPYEKQETLATESATKERASRDDPNRNRSQPFSGRIRPGDILGIDLAGGFDTLPPPPRTVEPDGNLVLGAIYGPASRVNVAGLTLIEAGQTITDKLKQVLKDPRVVVTYGGHDDGVVAEGAAAAVASTQDMPAPAAEPVLLQPLDTIEIILPLGRTRSFLSDSHGRVGEVLTGSNLSFSGTYVIEPDGRVALPEAGGRVKLAGLTTEEAGKQLREHLSVHLFPRIALPSVTVYRRGRAVFAKGKEPAADYRIKPGDTVLKGTMISQLWPTVVDADGNVSATHIAGTEKANLAGLSLEEAQAALRKITFKFGNPPDVAEYTTPWIVTLGGWREEADPRVIDRIEGHNNGVVAENVAATAIAPSDSGRPNSNAGVVGSMRPEPVVLQSLDTIEIIAPLKPRIRIASHEGQPVELNGETPNLSGTYLIEPDGRVALPHAGGRATLGGLTEIEAGEALRKHLSESFSTRTALPTTRVLRRGRAVFDKGSQPAADYKIKPGDKLLLGEVEENMFTYAVDGDGNLGSKQKVQVAGLTLEEAQEAARKNWTTASEFALGGRAPESAVPWLLTLGGWREEADPRVIDRIEGTDATQFLRMQEEMQELKAMIRRLQAE